MNPETGQFQPLDTAKKRESFFEHFAKSDDDLQEEMREREKTLRTERLSGDIIDLPEKSLLELDVEELIGQRATKAPIFTEGELLTIRGGAFRVGKITARGMMLRPVRDADLVKALVEQD